MYMDIKERARDIEIQFSLKRSRTNPRKKAKRKIMKLIRIYICRLLINMCSETTAAFFMAPIRETTIIMYNKVSPSLCTGSVMSENWTRIIDGSWYEKNFDAIKAEAVFILAHQL